MIFRQVMNIACLIDSLQYISHHTMKRERTANRLTQLQSILASLHLQMIDQQLKGWRKLETTPGFMLGTWKLWLFSISTKFQHTIFRTELWFRSCTRQLMRHFADDIYFTSLSFAQNDWKIPKYSEKSSMNIPLIKSYLYRDVIHLLCTNHKIQGWYFFVVFWRLVKSVRCVYETVIIKTEKHNL